MLCCQNWNPQAGEVYGSNQNKIGATSKVDSTTFSSDETIHQDALTLGTFKDLPPEIDGCGCYLFLIREDEVNGKYVFVDDNGSPAVISINNSIVRVKQVRKDANKEIFFTRTKAIM